MGGHEHVSARFARLLDLYRKPGGCQTADRIIPGGWGRSASTATGRFTTGPTVKRRTGVSKEPSPCWKECKPPSGEGTIASTDSFREAVEEIGRPHEALRPQRPERRRVRGWRRGPCSQPLSPCGCAPMPSPRPGAPPQVSSGTSSLSPLLIHRSAWKGCSANFACYYSPALRLRASKSFT